ncbi:MAG: PDZ domain-containing protein [Lachnospiraceae bacterium]|nr:PDZ domain-containing protein [Lachnospiraceae bacterium]
MDNFEANNNNYNNNYNNDYNNNDFNNNYNNNYDNNPKKNKNNRKKWLIGVGIALAAFIVISLGVTFVKSTFKIIDQYAAQMAGSNNADGNAENATPQETAKPVELADVGTYTGSAVDVSEIVEAAMPTVVSIVSTTSVQGYSMFGQPYEQEAASSGTGFIVGQNDTELLLATNNHVVEDSTGIQVTFNNEETAEAIVKGTAADADLAVIAVKLEDIDEETMDSIKIAVLGDSDKVKVGQMAIAIGNAQGMGQSVTVGYISAKDRKLDIGSATGETKTMSFLQTDAAINGGNSGGPLLNAGGEVVGINSAKISSTDVEGMCYAIPISQATPIIKDLMNRETLTEEERGYMGVSLQDISNDAVEMYGVPDGVYIAAVQKKSPADKAGLLEGDIITMINDIAVNSSSAAVDKVNSYRAGTEIKVVFSRRRADGNGYDTKETTVTLATAEEIGLNNQGSQDNAQDNDANRAPDNGNGNNGNNGNDDAFNDIWDDYFGDFMPW